MQDQQSWIFLPEEVDFYTSEDGQDYMNIHSSRCDSTIYDRRILKQYATAQYPDLNTRYIRIHAKNMMLPLWHHAAGKPAWLFVDEVIVR